MTLVQRSKPVSDPAWAAMSALNLAVAAFDGAPPRLSWRSPAFARLLPALEEGSLPGTVLSPAFDAAARGEPAWVASPDDGTVFDSSREREPLEFVMGKERGPLLARIIAAEEGAITDLLAPRTNHLITGEH